MKLKLFINLSSFVAAIAAVALLWPQPFFLAGILGMLLGLCLWQNHQRHHAANALFFGLVGPAAEIICVYFGAWSYGAPQVLGIPVWLPLLWSLAGLGLAEVNSYFSE